MDYQDPSFPSNLTDLILNVSDINITENENATLSTVITGYHCGPGLAEFGAWYSSIHGFSSLTVCLFGCVLNLLNLIVLTRKEMQNPTNCILFWLAVADFLNDLEYVPFSLMKILSLTRRNYPPKTYSWAFYIMGHSLLSQVLHTSSITLTLTLAIFRYISVAFPLKNRILCSMERAKLAVVIAYVGSFLVCIPLYFTFSIKDTSATALASATGNNATKKIMYYVSFSDLAQEFEILSKANFLMYSVVIKLFPCLVLTIASYGLIRSLINAKRRKAQLKGRGSGGKGKSPEEPGGDRTTRMLLVVLLLFLMTEFPQGILGLLTVLLGQQYFRTCYIPVGDLMDLIALSNAAANFACYISMSTKFREVFLKTTGMQKICSKRQVSESAVARPVFTIQQASNSNLNGNVPDT